MILICWFAEQGLLRALGERRKQTQSERTLKAQGPWHLSAPGLGKQCSGQLQLSISHLMPGRVGHTRLRTGKRPPKGRAGPMACGSNHYEQFVPCVSRSVTFCLGRLLWPLQVHSSSWCHTGSPMVFSAMSLMLALSLSNRQFDGR